MPFTPLPLQQTSSGFTPLPSPTPNPAPQQSLSDKIWSGLASATNAVQGGMTGIAKGIASVPFDLANVGEKILSPLDATGGAGAIQKPAGLTPQGTAENIGYGAEKLGEFFIPQGLITKTAGAVEKGVGALNIASKVGGKLGTVAEGAAKLVGRSATEALGQGGTAYLQSGGDTGQAKTVGGIAGAVPIIGKGLSVLSWVIKPAASISTGVSKEVLGLAKEAPQAMDEALAHIAENPKQPFFALANTIKDRLIQAKDAVVKTYTDAVDAFKTQFPRARFDLNPYFKEFTNPLKDFPTLNLEQTGTRNLAESGMGTTYQITKSAQSPFTQNEVNELNYLLGKVQASRNIGIDDLVGLRQSFARAYDAVPLANGNPTPYHAAVMALKDNAEKIIDNIMPAQMKAANGAYSNFEQMMSKVGNPFLKGGEDIARHAEGFLSNATGVNKGQVQKEIAMLEEATGIPIMDNIKLLKGAQDLSEWFPKTGSRTQDILRSLLAKGATGIGAAVEGGLTSFSPIGAAAGAGVTALMSPKIIGKAFTLTGKAAQQLGNLAEKYPEVADFAKTLFGASLK